MNNMFVRMRNLWRYPSWLYRTPAEKFPDTSSDTLRVLARLHAVRNELGERSVANNLGALYTLPHPLAAKTYALFLDQNPNHLGHWADKPPQQGATIRLEYEVIRAMTDLYGATGKHLTGYITSGATEGNIFSVWLGKTYLSRFSPPEKIRVLMTSLTHYSVRKAADICGVQSDIVGIHTPTWAMDPDSFLETARRLHKKGITGILLPLTLGYTSTGTSDDIAVISQAVTRLQKELPRLRIFVWIDAATQGLVTPFLSDFRPFRDPNIQTIVVDFHKYGLVPYSAGILLYRRAMQTLIERPIEYLRETDATLSGSRPGARYENYDEYVKRLKAIEDIATNKKGVSESFAIQAGREVRVIVNPEALTDDEAIRLSAEIRDEIKEKVTYPGTVTVTIIRELRHSEVAK